MASKLSETCRFIRHNFSSFATIFRPILLKIDRKHLALSHRISVLALDAIFCEPGKPLALNFRKYEASIVSPRYPISFFLAFHIFLRFDLSYTHSLAFPFSENIYRISCSERGLVSYRREKCVIHAFKFARTDVYARLSIEFI